MSDVPKKPDEMVKCPVCEGRGELEKQVLLDRLQEKDLARKISSYLANFVEADRKEEMHGIPPEEASKHTSDNWNLTHFLWRRSPKE
ncbi:MAG TPA: hypothetical protein VG897_19115 [Terriglobales bacterium]|nr:hypothetical protein [Terriglobales bacterium]